jgi:fatty acid desaturase
MPIRSERRLRPMSRREVVSTRLLLLLSAVLSGAALGLGWRWWPLIAMSQLMTFCIWFLTCTGHQRRQFLGLRPPADSTR